MSSLRCLASVLLASSAACLASGCYVETQPEPILTSASIEVDDYPPAYYDGYVVYYDDGGRPYYYENGAVVWVQPSSPYYPGLVDHWRVYGPAYRRWYDHYGYHYRAYRVRPGYHDYHGYRAHRR